MLNLVGEVGIAKMSPLSIEMLAIKEKIHLKRTIDLE
jgi:hypothetical protein